MKPPLITTDTDGWGCAARLRGRPSSLKGRCAIALRATALRAALDPGASTAPEAGTCGQAMGLPRPGAAHVPTSQVSTVSGDCQLFDRAAMPGGGPRHQRRLAGRVSGDGDRRVQLRYGGCQAAEAVGAGSGMGGFW